MQQQQQGAEASQDQTGGETPIAQVPNVAGQAIALRLYHRVDPGPGVISLNVTRHLSERVARLASGRLPMLDAIQRRWGPSGGGSWGVWPQLLYLYREPHAAVPAEPVETPAVLPSWSGRDAWATNASLPIVSALQLSGTPVQPAAAGPFAQSTAVYKAPIGVTRSIAAGMAREAMAPPGRGTTPIGAAPAPLLQPSVVADVDVQGTNTSIQASPADPESLPVVRGSRTPAAAQRSLARPNELSASPPPAPLVQSLVARRPSPVSGKSPIDMSSMPIVRAGTSITAPPPCQLPITMSSRLSIGRARTSNTAPTSGQPPTTMSSSVPIAQAGSSSAAPAPGRLPTTMSSSVPIVQASSSSTAPASGQSPTTVSSSTPIGRADVLSTTSAPLPAVRSAPDAASSVQRRPEHTGEAGGTDSSIPGASSLHPTSPTTTLPARAGPSGQQHLPGVVAQWGEPIVQRQRSSRPSPPPFSNPGTPIASPDRPARRVQPADETSIAPDAPLPANTSSSLHVTGPGADLAPNVPSVRAQRRAIENTLIPDRAESGVALARASIPGRLGHAPTAIPSASPTGDLVTPSRVKLAPQTERPTARFTAPNAAGLRIARARTAQAPAMTESAAAAPQPPDYASIVVTRSVATQRLDRGVSGETVESSPAVAAADRLARLPARGVKASANESIATRHLTGSGGQFVRRALAPGEFPTVSDTSFSNGSMVVRHTGVEQIRSAPDLLRAPNAAPEPLLVTQALPAANGWDTTVSRMHGDRPSAFGLPPASDGGWRRMSRTGSAGPTGVDAASAQVDSASSWVTRAVQRQAASAPTTPAPSPASPVTSSPEPTETTTAKNPQSADVDLEHIARAVYDLLEQRLRIERENRGL